MSRFTQLVGRIFNPDPVVSVGAPLSMQPNTELIRANLANAMRSVEGLRAKLALVEEQRDFLLNGLAVGTSEQLFVEYQQRFGK